MFVYDNKELFYLILSFTNIANRGPNSNWECPIAMSKVAWHAMQIEQIMCRPLLTRLLYYHRDDSVVKFVIKSVNR